MTNNFHRQRSSSYSDSSSVRQSISSSRPSLSLSRSRSNNSVLKRVYTGGTAATVFAQESSSPSAASASLSVVGGVSQYKVHGEPVSKSAGGGVFAQESHHSPSASVSTVEGGVSQYTVRDDPLSDDTVGYYVVGGLGTPSREPTPPPQQQLMQSTEPELSSYAVVRQSPKPPSRVHTLESPARVRRKLEPRKTLT